MRRIRPIRYLVSLFFLGLFLVGPILNQRLPGSDYLLGTTWSMTILGVKITNPLAATEMVLSSRSLHPELLVSIAIPLVLIALFGRFFCGWICPAGFIFELNQKLKQRLGGPDYDFEHSHKYTVLVLVLLLASLLGTTYVSMFHPPHVLGREAFLFVEYGFFGAGSLLFAGMLIADLGLSERMVCTYFCPTGAFFSLLGRFRLLRVRMEESKCTECGICNTECMFDLDPMAMKQGEAVGGECNNCADCIESCPQNGLHYEWEFDPRN